jgi:integrase
MKLKRVYSKHGAYYFVDTSNKWHRLCAIADGEAKLLRELAKHKEAPAAPPGSMQALVRMWREKKLGAYAASTKADYELMLPKIEMAFEDIDVADAVPGDVDDFIGQWADKPRQANKYRSLLSMMFDLACVHRLRHDNPCAPIKPLALGAKRARYITDAEFHAIRQGAIKGKDGRANASGGMIVCAIDLAFLTMQRMAEIRQMTWDEMDEQWLYFRPTKTRSTTGARVKVPRTPEINAVLERARSIGKVKSPYFVIHNLKGKPYTKSGIETAWDRACERAKVKDAHFHDLRAKAQTDAKRWGYTLQQIQDGATHASVATTEGYIKLREELESKIALPMPKS